MSATLIIVLASKRTYAGYNDVLTLQFLQYDRYNR